VVSQMMILTLWSHFDPSPVHGLRDGQTDSSSYLWNSVICTISSTYMLWIWHFSATSSCKLLENLICFSLITSSIEMCFCHTSALLPCILPPYTLFFLTNGNMTVEVENTGTAVGFLDPECLCSTTLNSTDNTLSSSVSYMCNAFKLYAKKIWCLPLISVRTTGLQWWLFRSSGMSTILIHWR
jgi:hypothetical protein